MKKPFVLFFLILTSFSFSQNNRTLDSLYSLLKTSKEDTIKVNTLIAIGEETKLNGDYDKAIEYSNTALKLAQRLNYKSGIAFSFNNFGNIMSNKGDYDQAVKNYSNALTIFEEIKDMNGFGSSKNGMGGVYFNQGIYLEALKCFSGALEIFKVTGNKKKIATTYNNIGAVYNTLGNYPKALENQLVALKLSEEIADKRSIASSYFNIGIIYALQSNYFLAKKYHSQSLLLAKELNDKKQIANSYNSIGNVSGELGNFPEALKNYSSCLAIRTEIGDKKGLSSVLHNIAVIYDKQGLTSEAHKNYVSAIQIAEGINSRDNLATFYINLGSLNIKEKRYVEARQNILKGLLISNEIGSVDDIRESYLVLTALDSTQANYKDAFEHHKLYIFYRDSLINEENTEKIVQSQMQYDFDKKEVETKREQEKKDSIIAEKAKIKDLTTIGLLVALLLVCVIAWLILRQNKLKSQQKSLQLEQKLLRSQMNPHFIFNSLIAIESYIYDNDPSTAGAYLSKFAQLMRQTLESSKEEYITLEKEIISLQNYLTLQQLRFENTFTFTIHIDESINTSIIKIPPMLTQPFIENSIEHGFKKNQGVGELQINFKLKDDCLIGEVIDNGIGIYQSQGQSEVDLSYKSMALGITKERLELLNKGGNKKINLNVEEIKRNGSVIGTGVYFSIPLKR